MTVMYLVQMKQVVDCLILGTCDDSETTLSESNATISGVPAAASVPEQSTSHQEAVSHGSSSSESSATVPDRRSTRQIIPPDRLHF